MCVSSACGSTVRRFTAVGRVCCWGGLGTITGDDTLIVEVSTQYCYDYGSCTDASVVAVDRGLQIVRSEKL
jgi:hypothetical protein